MDASTVYLWIEKVQLNGCAFSEKAKDLWEQLPKNSKNQAYWQELTRPSQRPEITSQRVTALGCFLQTLGTVAPHLLTQATLYREESGRPNVVFSGEDSPAVCFSLTHTPQLAVCALCMGNHRVGIDVEALIPFERAQKICRRFFTPQEQSLVSSASDERLCMTKLWTAKEAMFKCGGHPNLLSCDTCLLSPEYRIIHGDIASPKSILAVCLPTAAPLPNVLQSPLPLHWQNF